MPTTTGTGAESTTICVLDVLSLHVKTGISHAALRPRLAIVDPALTLTQPATVTAAAGMDILCHALESYTARWYADFDAKQPEQRVPYCGANPIADLWSEKALTLLSGAFRNAVRDGTDTVAREQMAMAATFAGLGLRQRRRAHPARQRLPDRRPGPLVRPRRLPGGRADRAARHGGVADRARGVPVHLRRRPRPAPARGPDARPRRRPATARTCCPACSPSLMRDIGIPNGLGEVGYGEADVSDLVSGAVQQQRLLATSPRTPTEEDLAAIIDGVHGTLVR